MLTTLEAPELVFGLCSAIGTKNSQFATILERALLEYGYSSRTFKITDLMKSFHLTGVSLVETPIEERYDSYIKYANKIREITGLKDALAIMGCAAIKNSRKGSDQKAYTSNQAYIFDQFKRPEEIDTLRQIYGKLFVLVSLYSEKEKRVRHLSHRISNDHSTTRPTTDHMSYASALAKRDEVEYEEAFGQRLSDTFALGDLFLNVDDLESATATLKRFLNLMFGSNAVSPTRDEYGMYIAKSAALRSLDLSRQVGAASFTRYGEVITLGSNEVPKAGGGTYWSPDRPDGRDYMMEGDENERIKKAILVDVVKRLHKMSLISIGEDVEKVADLVLKEAARKGSQIRDAQLMDLLEFGRIIHAEMSAISDAARLGKSLKDATLYCTTFPCHICAKHIVAAGIDRVVFIEPYPKSYAEELHQDSIVVGTETEGDKRVKFTPFIGISPVRFKDLFEGGRRKDDNGQFKQWKKGGPQLVNDLTIASYLSNETAMVKIMKRVLGRPKVAEQIKVGKIA